MVLSFPNQSRSFDSARNRVRFWGYDTAIEISFFIDADALQKLSPEPISAESGFLEIFDAARDSIEEVADKVYVRNRRDAYAYTLVAADF